MKFQNDKKRPNDGERKPVLDDRRDLVRDLHALPSSKIMNRILEADQPTELVQGLTSEDFFWLIKKVGDDDCLTLLELASNDQWEYLLDLEIWRKDRLDMDSTFLWMKQLQQADCSRLVRWLFSEGEYLGFYHFFRSVEVVVMNSEDEGYDIPEGFFSIDGVFHIRAIDSEYQETIESIIREMAREDFTRCQVFLHGLGGVLPAEMEEEMYRLRNVRLAEHGFLPYEESLKVYAPLNPEDLSKEKNPSLPGIFLDDGGMAMVPVSHLQHADSKNLLAEIISRCTDPLFLDRLHLEFASLCNQIMSADSIMVHELDILIKTCRKAAGFLNLALEKLCGKDISSAEEVLKDHPLESLFRVGIGLALKLKWEAERWLKGSWFLRQGLDPTFWGEHWGGILSGLTKKRPRLYVGLEEGEEYSDFEWLSELGVCMKILRSLMVLDGLLERLTELYPFDNVLIKSSKMTCHSLIFNLWGRLLLKMVPSFSALSLEQAQDLFQLLRAGSGKPPYEMPGFEEVFIQDFMAYVSNSEPEATTILKETLALIWQEFRNEYQWISVNDLDRRYSKYITIATSSEVALH